MERLTERELYDGTVCYTKCEKTHCRDKCSDCPVQQEIPVRLKEYEDAEEQGLLLRLPVAVGEEVYCIANFGGGYEICKNRVFSYQTAPKEIGGVVARGYNGLVLGIVGRTVFATREEAEAALAEKGGAE